MLPQFCLPLDEDCCPVADQTLGEMYRANTQELATLIATVPPMARALLAVYCYRRAHLASIGLAIAADCDKNDLMAWGGSAGAMLFDRSRETQTVPALHTTGSRRHKITLAAAPSALPSSVEDLED
jgi:hypothetical protein